MKTILGTATLAVLLSLATPAFATDKTDLDNRIRKLATRFEAMQAKPDQSIPPVTLGKAHGIVLLDRTKAGMVFGYQGGSGVALLRDPKSSKWGPPAFLEAGEGSFGPQIGGERNFLAVLLMNTNATSLVTEGTFEFGAEARGTAGQATAGAQGTVGVTEQNVLIYDDRKGFYGGVAMKGGVTSPDEDANRIYYGQPLPMIDILSGKNAAPTEAATELIAKLDENSKLPGK